MKKHVLAFLLIFGCFFVKTNFSYGQTFSMEREFPRAIVLPDSAYKILFKSDEVIRDAVRDVKREGKPAKKTLFQTTKVNLNNDDFPDLLVKGQSYLLGANVTRFWLFRGTQKGYVLLLGVPTHSLAILSTKKNKFKNIKTIGASAVQIYTNYYRFNGKKYIHSWSKIEDIK